MVFTFDNTFARLPESFSIRVDPTPVAAPEWVALNRPLAKELGIDPALLETPEGLAILSGNAIPQGAEPLSAAYSGHQFGGFSPLLGDGRAILLGEVIHRDGKHRDVQLKGAGPTPFSRRGDGRSALGPVIREYLVSEAMHALGVPTTRALAAVWSGERVYREEMEPGGVMTRVASSHLRIGSCEYFASRGDLDGLSTLVTYALERHYPERSSSETPALALLEGVTERQAALVAQWMGLGFIHGVMNTDNMSLSGETIDYGPCAFLDQYDPDKKFSYIDRGGRYAYSNQPNIAQWNLARLAEALVPLIDSDAKVGVEAAVRVLEGYPRLFRQSWDRVFSAKLGFTAPLAGGLASQLLELMHESQADFTLTFRALSQALSRDGENGFLAFLAEGSAPKARSWFDEWQAALGDAGLSASEATATMVAANPVYIPRNHRIEEVIQAAKRKDFAPFHRLHQVLGSPYEARPEFLEFESPPQAGEEVCHTFCGT